MNITRILKKKDLGRNFGWVDKIYKEGKLTICSRTISQETFNEFRTAVRLTNDIYENYWDIDFDAYGTKEEIEQVDIKGIVIYFPLVNITNRDSKSHTIKDLFIKIPFYINGNTDKLSIDRIKGGRTTISYAEYCSNYIHSHLSTTTYERTGLEFEWSPFCTGSGEINIYQANINADGFSERVFTQFLMQLMTIASYESIEGTPYRHISQIMVRSRNRQNYNRQSNSTIDNLLILIKNKLINEQKIPKLNFLLKGNKYELKDDKDFEEFIKIGIATESDKVRFLALRDPTGTYYRYGSSTSGYDYVIPNISISRDIIFQGNEYVFQVENIPTNMDISNLEYYVHPTVKEYIKNKIENDINKNKIRKSTIDRYKNTGNYVRKSSTADTVSM